METVFVVTAVVAATEFLRRLHVKDYFAAITIVLSAVIGLLAGVFHAPGVADAWTGIVLGLGASGLVTVGSRVGATYTLNKSNSPLNRSNQ